jgi:DNA-binding transcriptional MerR regulator
MGELSAATGVPVPTIKYYLRENLLPAGDRTGPNQASYDDAHVRRLRLIRALLDVGGLSVTTARQVIAAVDTPDLPLSWIFGVAQHAVSDTTLYEPLDGDGPGVALVDEAIERMGWHVHDDNPGRRGAARVLNTYAALGADDLAEISDDYARAAELIARADLAAVAQGGSVSDMSETVVIGTVLGDALVASLRRIAQEHVSFELFPDAVAPVKSQKGRSS